MNKRLYYIPLSLAAAAGSALAQDSRSPAQFDPPAAVNKLASADADLATSSSGPIRSWPDSPLSWRGITLRPHFDFSVTYGSGLRSRPGQSEKTVTETFAPGIAIQLGPQWTLDYTPRLIFYSDDDFKDTLAHSVSLRGGTTYRDWSFGLGQTYTVSEDPLIETAAQTAQETFGTSLSASRPLGSKLLLQLGAAQSFRFAEELNSAKSWSTMNWLNYQFAPRLSVAGGLGFGYDDVSRGSDMMNEQIQARINARIAQKLNLSINGGVEIRQFTQGDADDLVNPLYGASIQYRPFDYTTLSLAGNRRVSPSLFSNQITESTDISVALNQRLLAMFFLTLSVGYGTTEYIGSFGSLDESRSDDHQSFMASLAYPFLKRASASVFYQASKNSSSLSGFDYTTSTVGLNLSYRF